MCGDLAPWSCKDARAWHPDPLMDQSSEWPSMPEQHHPDPWARVVPDSCMGQSNAIARAAMPSSPSGPEQPCPALHQRTTSSTLLVPGALAVLSFHYAILSAG